MSMLEKKCIFLFLLQIEKLTSTAVDVSISVILQCPMNTYEDRSNIT